jgi:hypothetical protein
MKRLIEGTYTERPRSWVAGRVWPASWLQSIDKQHRRAQTRIAYISTILIFAIRTTRLAGSEKLDGRREIESSLGGLSAAPSCTSRRLRPGARIKNGHGSSAWLAPRSLLSRFVRWPRCGLIGGRQVDKGVLEWGEMSLPLGLRSLRIALDGYQTSRPR